MFIKPFPKEMPTTFFPQRYNFLLRGENLTQSLSQRCLPLSSCLKLGKTCLNNLSLSNEPQKKYILENLTIFKKVIVINSRTCQSIPPMTYTGLVSSGANLTSWGEGASLALVGHPSNNCITIKMPYGVDVLHQPASHPIFSYWVG